MTDELQDVLFAIEEELAGGAGEAYDHHLAEDATVVIPGATLDRAATVAAMDDSPGWDAFSLDERRMRRLPGNTALLIYRFSGRRGESAYEAILTSLYTRDPDDAWKLIHHQQTPITSSSA